MSSTPSYGLIAEFHDADQLVSAAQRTVDAGYRKVDAFTPFPVHGLAEAIRFKDNRVQLLVLAGGITGAMAGFGGSGSPAIKSGAIQSAVPQNKARRFMDDPFSRSREGVQRQVVGHRGSREYRRGSGAKGLKKKRFAPRKIPGAVDRTVLVICRPGLPEPYRATITTTLRGSTPYRP